MKRQIMEWMTLFVVALSLLAIPSAVYAQAEQLSSPPPIEQPLLREGSLAVQLVAALGLGGANDEAAAETILGNAGISPRNGWIADYPVTPDIAGELRQSITDAAEAGNIPLDADEALDKLDDIISGTGISVSPSGDSVVSGNEEYYPGSTVINNYYYEEGPPVVTYYTPPAAFYYLYSWIPYPFWCGSFWFPGYFMLNDFHRTLYVGHRHYFVSNHYRDRRAGRIYRINPRSRFDGGTRAGIGFTHHRGGDATENRTGGTIIYNSPGSRSTHEMETTRQGHGTFSRYDHGRNNIYSGHTRSYSVPSRTFTRPSAGNFHRPGNHSIPQRSFRVPQRSYNSRTHENNFPARNFSAPQRSFTHHDQGFRPTPAPRVNTTPARRGGGGFSGGFNRRR